MIQQSMRLKLLILPASLAVTVLIAVFFIKPSFSELMAVRKTLAEKNSQLETLKSQEQKLQNLKSKWESLGEEKTLVETALPETEDMDSFISELTSKAARSGVLLSDVKLSDQQIGLASDTPTYICGAVSAGNVSPAVVPGEDVSGSAAISEADCLKAAIVSTQVKGSWEQILGFFKYLEDMNRISNIKMANLSSESQLQGQPPSDLLTADISVYTFFKEKKKGGNAALAGILAGQGNFNQGAINKLKEVIYAPYSAPAVSPGGQRNIFK